MVSDFNIFNKKTLDAMEFIFSHLQVGAEKILPQLNNPSKNMSDHFVRS